MLTTNCCCRSPATAPTRYLPQLPVADRTAGSRRRPRRMRRLPFKRTETPGVNLSIHGRQGWIVDVSGLSPSSRNEPEAGNLSIQRMLALGGIQTNKRFTRRLFGGGTLPSYLVMAVLIVLIVGAVLTTLLPKVVESGATMVRREQDDQRIDVRNSFTIIMQSYNRTDLLLKLLNHYQAVPNLHKIIVVWNSVGIKPPKDLWDSLGPHPIPIIFKEQTVNRMRNRLEPFPELETKAVLMVDDDILISAYDLDFSFSVWQQFPDQIVGFVPRKHVTTSSGIYSYGSFELQNAGGRNGDHYSMVLIGAAFFHVGYLEKFKVQLPAVHTLIDKTQNCDDIAMNFIVAKYTGKPSGLFVKPVDMRNLEKDSNSGFNGMWHRAEHLLQRSWCLNQLAAIYGSMPLKYSNIMISQFGFPNYANHKTKS
ncbi:exostosin-like 2 isoform X1 [Narcine bancroftii]|uniref:exostosin-like 2 isoform X1 n=1 Tax=Narcine bancroftii TaxID=1343680 RepID=UPI0038313DF2